MSVHALSAQVLACSASKEDVPTAESAASRLPCACTVCRASATKVATASSAKQTKLAQGYLQFEWACKLHKGTEGLYDRDRSTLQECVISIHKRSGKLKAGHIL
jgi:hypothetical protein